MIAVTLYFPDEMEQAIKAFGHAVGINVDRPVPLEYRVAQFYCGMICASLVTMGRPDLSLEFKRLNYRHTETPQG